MIVKPMRLRFVLFLSVVLFGVLVTGVPGQAQQKKNAPAKQAQKWQGVHLLNYNNDADLEKLTADLPKLAAQCINFVTLTSRVLGPDGQWTQFMQAHYRRKI